MLCPKCGTEINLGRELSRLSIGKPRHFSQAEKNRRKARLAVARLKRWPAKPVATVADLVEKMKGTI